MSYISPLYRKICEPGPKKMVCCDNNKLLTHRLQGRGHQPRPDQVQQYSEVFLGKLIPMMHDVSGDVYAVGSNQILIKKFTYDGTGPDAFFLAGTSGTRPSVQGIPIPYPYTGVNYQYGDNSNPKLGKFSGDKEVVLTLPPGVDISQLKWLGVWCRRFEVSFGHILL